MLPGNWVYKVKTGPNGQTYKARLVAKGYMQRQGLEFNNIFALVAKATSVCTFLALAAVKDLAIEQMNVKTAFLYSQLEEKVYVEQPTGYVQGSSLVCQLNKALYRLKQSSRT